MSLCHKLWFSNHYIFGTKCCRTYIFQTMNSVESNILSLKYQRFLTSGFQDIGVWIFEFAAKAQFLLHFTNLFHRFLSFFFQNFLHRKKPVFSQLNPLIRIPHHSVLYEGPEDHEEANLQVDVDGLHVGDLRQSSIYTRHQGCHGEHCGYTQPNSRIE